MSWIDPTKESDQEELDRSYFVVYGVGAKKTVLLANARAIKCPVWTVSYAGGLFVQEACPIRAQAV